MMDYGAAMSGGMSVSMSWPQLKKKLACPGELL
jgi:hypothetical protein